MTNADTGSPARPIEPSSPALSVVLCTLGRHAGLRRTVNSVLVQRDVDFELVVVDNAPESGDTVAALSGLSDDRVRYVAEPRRGLSVARNTGIAAARGDLIAFTDDDCSVQDGWLAAIAAAFADHPGAAAVTGRTLADGAGNVVEQLFEEFGSFNRGDERRVWHYDPNASAPQWSIDGSSTAAAIFPYSAVYGSGNNMAFRASALATIGPFDESLGAGSPAAGGEDLDMFVRIMLAGQVLVYEPAAVIWHTHRADVANLAVQVHAYGSGLSAMITKHVLLDAASRRRILRRVGPGLRHLLSARSPKNARRSASFPMRLTWAERLGLVRGPWLYLRGRALAAKTRPRPITVLPERPPLAEDRRVA